MFVVPHTLKFIAFKIDKVVNNIKKSFRKIYTEIHYGSIENDKHD